MLECPLYNSTRDKFLSLFEIIVFWSFESFFQLDHQVDISLYLIEATTLHHFGESTSLTLLLCTFNPISVLAFEALKSFSFHLNCMSVVQC